jgi:hypothetical protein
MAMTTKGLGAHAAKDTLWRAIALKRFPYLATTFALLPVPKPPFKSLFCNILEATRATVLNESQPPEIPTVTMANYIFQYEIFIDGTFTESWAGKVDFCVIPSKKDIAKVGFPLTEECTRLVGSIGESWESWKDYANRIKVRARVLVIEAATLRAAMIFPKNATISEAKVVGDGTIRFESHTIAELLPAHIGLHDYVGELRVCPRIVLPGPNMLEDPANDARGSLQLKFRWQGLNDLTSVTQNEFLLQLQKGAIFNYREAPTVLA